MEQTAYICSRPIARRLLAVRPGSHGAADQGVPARSPLNPLTVPAITVVMPTYGHCSFVLESLASVSSQGIRDVEVIVVNDGSPDDTEAVLAPLVRSGRIRYIRQTNQGQAAARNRGLAEARGEFIAFLDDDDLWPADKLGWQVAALRADPALGAVGGGAVLIDAADAVIGRADVPDGEVRFADLFRGNPFLSPGQVVARADVLRRVGGLSDDVWGADDYDLWLRIARVARIRCVNRPALLYRKHAGNASRHAGRLLASTERVLRRHGRHLPCHAWRGMRKEVYRGLYWWLGREFVRDLRTAAGRGDVAASLASVRALRPIARAAAADPFLPKQMLADLFEPCLERVRARR